MLTPTTRFPASGRAATSASRVHCATDAACVRQPCRCSRFHNRAAIWHNAQPLPCATDRGYIAAGWPGSTWPHPRRLRQPLGITPALTTTRFETASKGICDYNWHSIWRRVEDLEYLAIHQQGNFLGRQRLLAFRQRIEPKIRVRQHAKQIARDSSEAGFWFLHIV